MSEYVTGKEAIEIYSGLTRSNLDVLVHRKQIKVYHYGNRRMNYYSTSELDRLFRRKDGSGQIGMGAVQNSGNGDNVRIDADEFYKVLVDVFRLEPIDAQKFIAFMRFGDKKTLALLIKFENWRKRNCENNAKDSRIIDYDKFESDIETTFDTFECYVKEAISDARQKHNFSNEIQASLVKSYYRAADRAKERLAKLMN